MLCCLSLSLFLLAPPSPAGSLHLFAAIFFAIEHLSLATFYIETIFFVHWQWVWSVVAQLLLCFATWKLLISHCVHYRVERQNQLFLTSDAHANENETKNWERERKRVKRLLKLAATWSKSAHINYPSFSNVCCLPLYAERVYFATEI